MLIRVGGDHKIPTRKKNRPELKSRRMSVENVLLTDHHVLWCLDDKTAQGHLFLDLSRHFCGRVVVGGGMLEISTDFSADRHVYACGDMSSRYASFFDPLPFKTLRVIRELSTHCDAVGGVALVELVELGAVPIHVHGVGVYFRKLFPDQGSYFDRVLSEHKFQSLTESNKPDLAFRKGIYLSRVEQAAPGTDEAPGLAFHLLRCSSNLDGPTENFRDADLDIVARANEAAREVFRDPVDLNHVLAQVYTNPAGSKKKAKIKAHSDKTKDMPRNGLIAFCTFYDSYADGRFHLPCMDGISAKGFDHVYRDASSILTRLHFKLKASDRKDLVGEFDVVLYPNSAFFISLETNRLYTHEIRPSVLPSDKIPTRLGYVVRCSSTRALWKDGQTWLQPRDRESDGKDSKVSLAPLEPITDDARQRLRDLYYRENSTTDPVHYGEVLFSMNQGDYLQPVI